MGRFDFVSPGAMASEAIQRELMQREMLKRQAMLDERARQAQEALEADRQENRRIQAETQARLRRADDVENARRVVEESWEGDRPDVETQALLRRTGYGGAMREKPGTTAEFLGQDPSSGQDFYSEATPAIVELRGGSRWLNQQNLEEGRAARAAAATEAAAERQRQTIEAQNERTRQTIEAQNERARQERQHEQTLATIRGNQRPTTTRELPATVDTYLAGLKGRGLNRRQAEEQFWRDWPTIQGQTPGLTAERAQQAINRMFAAPRADDIFFGEDEEPDVDAEDGGAPAPGPAPAPAPRPGASILLPPAARPSQPAPGIMAQGGSGLMVNMRAPDGTVKPIPAEQVEHYRKLGAQVVGQ